MTRPTRWDNDETRCPICGWTLLDDGSVVVDPAGDEVVVHYDCATALPTGFTQPKED